MWTRVGGFGLIVALALGPGLAHAERAPKAGPQDARIRKVIYSARDVVNLQVHYGFHTLVEFAQDERIGTILLGDEQSWEAKPVGLRNTLTIKALEENAPTNLTVITDRRTYTFFLRSQAATQPSKMTWRVQFEYPEDEARAREAAAQRVEIERTAYVNPDAAPVDARTLNFRYTFAGSKRMVPSLLFDDGSFTYFRFEKQSDLPAIFVVGPEKKEALANYRIEGEYVVVHRVAGQFALRIAGELTCIFNETREPSERGPSVNGPQERTAAAPQEGARVVDDPGPEPRQPGHFVSKPGPGWRAAPR